MNASKKEKVSAYINCIAGFTLVELMIALVVSSLIMAAVVTVYIAQSRSYTQQDDLANIQQDLRGALAILSSEVRVAGCDPTQSSEPKILVATRTQFRLQADTRDDANPRTNDPDGLITGDEDIAYALTARNDTTEATIAADTDGNGIVDSGGANWLWANNTTPALGRQIANGGGFQPLANNIEALEFNYIVDDGDAGVNDGKLCNGLTISTVAPTNPNKICAVQVSLLARAANPDPGFVNTNTYTTVGGTVWNPTPDDNFRRRLMVATIQVRNMGM